jgi:hypothetical protein
MAVLNNVSVMWAMVHQPDTKFAPTWKIQAMLSEEQAKKLSEEAKAVHKKGISIKRDENNVPYFVFKRKVARNDGTENSPPLVCGKGGPKDVFTDNIGNGSICNIQYAFIPYKNSFGEGIVQDLRGVQVIKHVPYSGSEFEEVDAETQEEEDENPFD